MAVYRTSSAGSELIYCLLTREGYDVAYVDQTDVEAGKLGYFEAAVFPGGSEHVWGWMWSPDFRAGLKCFVRKGGRFVGVCGGALVGVWLVNGFWHNALTNIPNGLYYAYYILFKRRGKFLVGWNPGNRFGKVGSQMITWVGGPALSGGFSVEAVYGTDKWLLPFKDKTAVGFAKYGYGSVVMFGPHPEYPVDGVDNSGLILQAIEI